MIPAPRASTEIVRVVPCPVGHLGSSCLLARGHTGACLPAPGRVVLAGAR